MGSFGTSICYSSVGLNIPFIIRKDITLVDIHIINQNSFDGSLNSKMISASKSSKILMYDLCSFCKRKSSNIKCLKRSSCFDSLCHLVLLFEHIDLITFCIDKITSLLNDCKGRTLSNELRNSTFIKYHVHKDPFMHRECKTHYRIHFRHISSLKKTISIVLVKRFHISNVIVDLFCCHVCRIIRSFNKEISKRLIC